MTTALNLQRSFSHHFPPKSPTLFDRTNVLNVRVGSTAFSGCNLQTRGGDPSVQCCASSL